MLLSKCDGRGFHITRADAFSCHCENIHPPLPCPKGNPRPLTSAPGVRVKALEVGMGDLFLILRANTVAQQRGKCVNILCLHTLGPASSPPPPLQPLRCWGLSGLLRGPMNGLMSCHCIIMCFNLWLEIPKKPLVNTL